MTRAALLLSLAATLVACSSNTPAAPPPAGSCAYDSLVAVSGYQSSGVGGFTLQGNGYVSYGILSGDPALSASNGRAFLVMRDVGQIAELDPYCGTPLDGGLVSTNGGSTRTTNPQDVAAAPDRSLWVPRYDDPSVIQIGIDGGIQQTISLSSTTYDPDGNPNASAIAILPVCGVTKAFVALEVLDDNAIPYPVPYANNPSLILRIDVASGRIDGQTRLAGRNPFGLFFPYGGSLWMAEPGSFQLTNEGNAGIERFDPQTQTSVLLVAEPAFEGGSVAEVAVTSGCGAAIIADATSKNATSLVTFDPDTGAVLTTAQKPVFSTSGYDLQGMVWAGSVLLVGDRTPATGGTQRYPVHAFTSGGGCVLTQRPDAIFLQGLPPVGFQPTP